MTDEPPMAAGNLVPRKRRRLRLACTRFLIVVGLVASVECVLRLAFGLGNPVLVKSDAACEYILKPDQHVFRFFAHVDTDRNGMRSDELLPSRRPRALRLLFVGDSITYGTSRVDQHRIFTELLHRDLPAIVHQPVEVLNASAGGWALDNELSFVRSRGLFQSNVVLLILNDEDLTQPRATMDDSMPVKQPATAIGELCARLIFPWLFHAHGKAENPSSDDEVIIRSNLADLDAFRALVAEHHAELRLVYVPFRKNIPTGSAKAAAAFQAWAATNQAPFLDLTSEEASRSREEITLGDGAHLSARGHEIVAQAIERSWNNVVQQR